MTVYTIWNPGKKCPFLIRKTMQIYAHGTMISRY